jgi:hypothetical protein
MPTHAPHSARRRAPTLAALLACAVLASAPTVARAADPGLTLTALAPGSWWQADGSVRVPLRLQVSGLVSIDRLEIEVVGLPGLLSVAVPTQPVDVVEGPGLGITLPGIAGTRTIRVTAWLVGDQPSYGVGPATVPIVAETIVTLAPPHSLPGAGVTPLSQPTKKAGPTGGTAVRPRILVLRIRTIKGRRYAFVKSTTAVKLELLASRRVGRTWRPAKRVRTRLVAKQVRRVPLALVTPGRYQLRAVVRDVAGLTGTRRVALSVRAAVRP